MKKAVQTCSSVKKRLATALVCTLATLTAPGLSWSQDQGLMDEKALTSLKQMSDYLAGASALSFRSSTFFDIIDKDGIKVKSGRQSDVIIKRPDKLYINANADDGSAATIWYDGEKLTYWRRDTNEAMSLDFKGTTDAMLDHLVEVYDIQLPLTDLLYSSVNKMVSDNIVSAKYIGARTVGGVPTHQLSMESAGADWQIWIEADSTPVPRRYAIDLTGQEHQPQFLATLDNWSIGREVDDYYFTAALPDSTKTTAFKKPEAQ